MLAPPLSVPFESQAGLDRRGCGAACLSMVYKSFGKDVPPAGIWPLIAKPNRFGIVSSTTHLMALHAINQGLSAVVMKARHPLQVLRLSRDAGIRAILNHRPQPDSETGHYTVLADIDDWSVMVHDPGLGPSRRLSHAELMKLWQPHSAASEIAGNILIGISAEPIAISACEFCHTAIPPQVNCPRCRKPVGLSPATMLGCIREGCIARMWEYVACPECDFVFNERTKSSGDAPKPAAAKQRPPALTPPDLNKTFAQLDRFCAHILSNPLAAGHPDLRAQLDFIQANKEKLRLGQAEEIASINAHLDRLAAADEKWKRAAEARRKEKEKRDAPLPPLDANALGEALLRTLGFQHLGGPSRGEVTSLTSLPSWQVRG